MSDNTRNIDEIIVQAMDTIVKKRLETLKYDKTIICTITDNSQAADGIYTVSDGEVSFTATSGNTDYRLKQNVYVLIPQGDYTQNKTIIGKYVSEDGTTEPFTWISPMNNFLNITDNLIDGTSETGLVANDPVDGEDHAFKHIETWANPEDLKIYKGYDRLGFSAEFRTNLSNMDAVSGSYGLIVVINGKSISNEKDENEEYITKDITRTFTLDTADMWGNPYNFEAYFKQEGLCDISEFITLDSINVYFYQNNNFTSDGKIKIPHDRPIIGPNTGEEIGRQNFPNNLFVKNISLTLGYSITEESLFLKTFDSLSYKARSLDEKSVYNNKTLRLR